MSVHINVEKKHAEAFKLLAAFQRPHLCQIGFYLILSPLPRKAI
jgi:hypothetical protein